MSRTIIVGDIHGCLRELELLLAQMNYVPGEDRLISVGDLVDRGPEGPRVVQFFKETPNTFVVMGNHEESHARFYQHELEHYLHHQYKNPMSFSDRRLAEHRSYRECDFIWMSKLPKYLRLRPDLVVVHAGLRPGIPVEQQKPGDLTHLRFVDDKGKPKALDRRLGQPLGTVFWTEQYYGSDNVIYGHNAASLTEVSWHATLLGKRCIGLDTGCVFGGRLSALVLDDSRPVAEATIHQVQATDKYAEWHPPRE